MSAQQAYRDLLAFEIYGERITEAKFAGIHSECQRLGAKCRNAREEKLYARFCEARFSPVFHRKAFA